MNRSRVVLQRELQLNTLISNNIICTTEQMFAKKAEKTKQHIDLNPLLCFGLVF